MADQRVVIKSLAGEEDMLFGRSPVNQSRAGATYPITPLSIIKVVTSVAAMDDLEPTEFPLVAVIDGLDFTLYEYINPSYTKVRVSNARVKRGAAFRLTAEAVTPIITTGVPTRVEGTTVMDAASEQFTHASGRLTYTGDADLFKVDVNLTVRDGNQDELNVSLALNGGVLSDTTQVMPASASAAPRSLSFSTYLELESSNQLEVFVSNQDDTTDVEVAQYNMAVSSQ